MEETNRYCKVCVTGGSGFIGSLLIYKLLNKSVYCVHATLRNLAETSKVELLKQLPGAEKRLKLFEADIYNPQQFEAAIKDCQYVFHVATPFMHSQHSQYKDVTEAAVVGAKSIIESCRRSGTVKRLIYTAGVFGILIAKDYLTSKTESEKETLRYAEDGNLEIITLTCGLVGGETLLPYTPLSTKVVVSQLIEIELHYEALRLIEELLGKIPILHIEDTCEAHIFCIEKDSLHGRFLCASNYVSSAEIAEYLQITYPEFQLKQVYLNGPTRTTKWASTKLIDQGFKYKYDMKVILDDSVKCAKRFGCLS